MEYGRQKEFQRNEKLEALLKEINGLLEPVEDELIEGFSGPKYPVLLVVGGPRCGSTLMMQWLAKTGVFGYPSNLLARFYDAPCLGAKIQLLLTAREYNFRNEIFDFSSDCSFKSNLGKTQGALEPNDFWYFWRRFIPHTEPVYFDENSLKKINRAKFVAELAAIESVFNKPFAMKGMLLEQNITFLSSIFEKVLFVYLKRHPFYNIQSLLESRVKFFNDRSKWYSIKPKEYDQLKDLDPIEQVAGQVYFKNRVIEQGLAQIDHSRWLQVNYEDFCASPARLFDEIREKYAQQGYKAEWSYKGSEQFQSANNIRLSKDDCEKIVYAYRKFSGRDITP